MTPKEFRANTDTQERLIETINHLAELASDIAEEKGFNEDAARTAVNLPSELLPWFENCVLQAEVARQISELGEAIEGIRKPHRDKHCPQFDNFVVEQADCIIRIFDTCGKRGLPLGEAIVEKMLANMGREHKHGKNS